LQYGPPSLRFAPSSQTAYSVAVLAPRPAFGYYPDRPFLPHRGPQCATHAHTSQRLPPACGRVFGWYAGEIESAITAFARDSNGGLIVLGSSLANVHRELIITLAASHRLPAVYSDRIFVTSGGLISYGPNRIDQFQRGAVYVDRILKGEKPFDLPVQEPTKYELFINLKTARALGLTVPPTLLALADDVIE
jgi:hypothetical protein